MNTLIFLFLNLFVTAWLIYMCVWLFGYDMRWWLRVQRAKNLFNGHFKKRVLLEIKMPREVTKSPAAMEIVLGTITCQTLGHSAKGLWEKVWNDVYNGKDKKFTFNKFFFELNWSKFWLEMRKYWQDRYVKGGVRGWYSLEIISEEGKIRFFIYTYDKHVDMHKNALYAQYPGVEVVEVEDYTLNHHYKPGGDFDLYIGRWKLKKPDYLPIKTYVDYELDKNPKEEHKVDPLLPLLETLASAGKGEHYWLQLMVRATINDNWKKSGQDRIDQLLKITRFKKDDPEVKEGKAKEGDIKKQEGSILNLQPVEKNEVEIITRNFNKDGLDCFLRFYGLKYKLPGTKISVSKNILPIVYGMKPFDSVGYNAFGFETITWDTDYPWMDPKSEWSNTLRTQWFENYVMRAGYYFEAENFPYSPWLLWKIYRKRRKAVPTAEWANGFWNFVMHEYYGVPEIHPGGMGEFILNTEEVATIFHLPSKIHGSSGNLVGSTKSDPPLNLPI